MSTSTKMNAGKIILLVVGIIMALTSISLIAGGANILYVDARYVDNTGFLNSDTVHINRDSSAVVFGQIELDEIALRVLQTMGLITVFEFEATNNVPSKGVFIGVAEQAELDRYLDNVDYDEVNSFRSGWTLQFRDLTYISHSGSSLPTHPVSKSFWVASATGTESEKLEWRTEAGNHSVVLMNGDGSKGVDLDVVFKTKIPSVFGYGLVILLAGIILLAIAGSMVFLAVRRRS